MVLCVCVCVPVSLISMRESIHMSWHTCEGHKATSGVIPHLPPFFFRQSLCCLPLLTTNWIAYELPGILCLHLLSPFQSNGSADTCTTESSFFVCSGDLNSDSGAPAARALPTEPSPQLTDRFPLWPLSSPKTYQVSGFNGDLWETSHPPLCEMCCNDTALVASRELQFSGEQVTYKIACWYH